LPRATAGVAQPPLLPQKVTSPIMAQNYPNVYMEAEETIRFASPLLESGGFHRVFIALRIATEYNKVDGT
jgi:hypothetical protein